MATFHFLTNTMYSICPNKILQSHLFIMPAFHHTFVCSFEQYKKYCSNVIIILWNIYSLDFFSWLTNEFLFWICTIKERFILKHEAHPSLQYCLFCRVWAVVNAFKLLVWKSYLYYLLLISNILYYSHYHYRHFTSDGSWPWWTNDPFAKSA